MIERGEIARKLPFMRFHNPLGRHVGPAAAERQLEDAGLMDRIAVNIHPRPGAAPGVFGGMRSGRRISTTGPTRRSACSPAR